MSWRHGKAYAQDLRDQVLAAPGRFGRWHSALAYPSHERLGQASAGAQCNHVPLLAQVAKAPEQTLAQLCQWV